MSEEQAFKQTEEKTKEVLEFYYQYLSNKLKEKHGDNFTLTYKLTPKYYDYDAIFYFNGDQKLHVEVKIRDYLEINRYPQTKIGFRKYAVALAHLQHHKTQTIYLALFQDCLAYLYLNEAPDEITSMVARHDRGDEQDEYAMYNVSRFLKIG